MFDLAAIYDNLTRTAIHMVKPDNIATFLGRKLHPHYQDEMGNRFNIRIAGTRIKHTMGPVSLKLYDKFGLILRLETTVNDLSFFKHYRQVEHRDGRCEKKWAPLRKTIYSLPALRQLLVAANRRYLQFLSTLEDPRAGVDKLRKLSRTVRHHDRSYTGFNFFDEQHQTLFEAIARGEFNISGFKNKSLRRQSAGPQQRPGLPLAQAPPRPRIDQKDRPNLQILSHLVGQTGDRDRAQAQGTLPPSRAGLPPRPLNQISCPNVTGFQYRGTKQGGHCF